MHRKDAEVREGHAITSPGARLLKRIKLAFVQEKISGRGRRSVSEGLNLTAFIDFLLVTVIFLLMSFSANGEIIPDRNIKIPSADSGIEMLAAPMVAVDGNQIRVNGHNVGSVRRAYDDPGIVKLDGLFALLTRVRENYQVASAGDPFPGVCILQIDEDVPSKVVKSVFHTAALAGYANISFMVKQRNL